MPTLGALGRLGRALAAALAAPEESDALDFLMRRSDELQGSVRDRKLLRDRSIGDQVGSIQALLEAYRSDPTGSVQQLRQAQDETERLRAALRFARDSARDDRIR